MNKIAILGLVSLLSVGVGLAASVAPASAATIAECRDSVTNSGSSGAGEYTSDIDARSGSIVQALKAKGVNVQDISDWGGCVKADVVRPNGTAAIQFFDPDTLQRLHRS